MPRQGTKRYLTPETGVQATPPGLSPRHPNLIAVGLNDRDPRWHDLWHVDLATGERRLVRENREEITGYFLDRDLVPRLVMRSQPDGGQIVYKVTGEKLDTLEPQLTIPFDDRDTTTPSDLTADGKAYYLMSSIGRDRTALFRVDLESGAQTLVAEHPKADIDRELMDPYSGEVVAGSAEYERQEWIGVDPKVAVDLAWLRDEIKTGFHVDSQTANGARWVIAGIGSEAPPVHYLFDRGERRLTRLFTGHTARFFSGCHPDLERYSLARMTSLIVRSRDDLDLVSYLTLPASETRPRPARPLPMVLKVHGGPWRRDSYGYDREHQWLANRGYAVLSVNFRGSSGFGKAFLNAGNLEWGRKMHDDLIDAVGWATREGIADPSRVAIMGASYGGYAALVGAAFTPETFRCAVSVVGPSSLETFLASLPAYWHHELERWARRVGDLRTEAGRALLRERSPLTRVGAISRPLLVMQGANDPRVKQAESDQIVAAVRARGVPVTYVLYPDAGHGAPARTYTAITEAFLALHLGGHSEPIGDDLRDSNIQVQGAELVPGLAAALAARPRRAATASDALDGNDIPV
jgi:dienelactone hydrolase